MYQLLVNHIQLALKPALAEEDSNLLVGSSLPILKCHHRDEQGESPPLLPTMKHTLMLGVLVSPLKAGKKKVSIFVSMIGKTKLLVCNRKNKNPL